MFVLIQFSAVVNRSMVSVLARVLRPSCICIHTILNSVV